MIDHDAVHLALRNRALGLSVATTGSVTLSATATGYARAAGSFLTDGFREGMEVVPAGFPQTDVGVITVASALTLAINGGRTVAGAAAARSLSVALPQIRAWENLEPADGATPIQTPIAGRPFLEEDYVPATHRLVSFPPQNGMAEETGLYVLKWYGVPNLGTAGIRKAVNALAALFAPGTAMTAGSITVRVRSDTSPVPAQIVPTGDGWSVCVLRIPWRAYSLNTIAA